MGQEEEVEKEVEVCSVLFALTEIMLTENDQFFHPVSPVAFFSLQRPTMNTEKRKYADEA